jgi:hypothetical protein
MDQYIDLGLPVNQDLPPSKLQKAVYDSENFRITSDEGGTFTARTNIKGTVNTLAIPCTGNVVKIFPPSEAIGTGTPINFSLDITIDGTVYNFDPISFLYIDKENYIRQVYNVLVLNTFGIKVSLNIDQQFITLSGSTGLEIISVSIVGGPVLTWSPYGIANNSFQRTTIGGAIVSDISGWTSNPASPASGSFRIDSASPIPNLGYVGSTVSATINKVGTLTGNALANLDPGNYRVSMVYNLYYTGGPSVPAVGSPITAINLSVNIGGQSMGTSNPIRQNTYTSFTQVYNKTLSIVPTNNTVQIVCNQTALSGIAGTVYFSVTSINLEKQVNVVPIIDNTFIPSQCNNKIIGWTNIRDDIYLFTTNEIAEPGEFTSSYGQVWKFIYAKQLDAADTSHYFLELKYNGLLNFTAARPIANPGGVEIRYESPQIQKIYWTDNNNRPRVINVADPDLFSKTPDEFNLVSSINFDIPIITEIVNGALDTGMYQIAYRLVRSNGVESRFSLPSKSVFLNSEANQNLNTTSPHLISATNTGVNSGKAIKVKIDNIDTTFDKIQMVGIYYGVAGSVPTVNIFFEDFISDRTTIEALYDGNETLIPITVDELSAFAPNILRCKTLATHRNTLFLANVKLGKFDVNFDSRTYRFPYNSNLSRIFHQGVHYQIRYTNINFNTSVYEYLEPISNTWQSIPEDWDAVQPYEDSINQYDQSPYHGDQAFLYIPNASDYTAGLGGAGPNISYEFVTKAILEDEVNIGNAFTPNSNANTGLKAPYKNVTTKPTTIVDTFDHQHPAPNYYEATVSPYLFPLLAGYQRDEMYRTGIVFYDKFGNESFVKWIGDIRIPHVYMPNGPLKTNRVLTFPLVNYINSKAYTNQVYIKFNVDLRNLSSDIKAFSIVVAPRPVEDRRILGQGILEPGYKADSIGGQTQNNVGQDGRFVFTTNGARNPSGSNGYSVNAGTDSSYTNIYPSQVDRRTWNFFMNMKSAEFLFKGFSGYQSGDHFDIVSLLDVVQQGYQNGGYFGGMADGDSQTSGGGNNAVGGISSGVFKHYSHVPLFQSIINSNAAGIYNIIEAQTLARYTNSGLSERQNFPILTNNWQSFSGTQFTDGFVVNCSPPSNTNSNTVDGSSIGIPSVGIVYGRTPSDTYKDFLSEFYNFPINNVGALGFLKYDGWATTGNRVYIGNYKRSLNKQYGGNSFSERSNTEYRYADNFTIINSGDVNKQVLLVSGDTYTNVYEHYNQTADYDRLQDRSNLGDTVGVGIDRQDKMTLPRVYCTPMESTLNLNLKRGELANVRSLQGNADSLDGIECPNIESYDKGDADLFSWQPSYRTFFPKPFDATIVEEYDCRTYKTEAKIDNEEIDSWSVIKPQAYLDVDSKYGPINNLILFRNGLYYFQDRAFGRFQVAEQKLLSDAATNSDLILGSAGVLERYDYFTFGAGSKHQFSFGVSPNAVVFFDVLGRKIQRIGIGEKGGITSDQISDVKGISAYIYNYTEGNLQVSDNPYKGNGVHATYDTRHNEFYMTFLDYNEDAQTQNLFTWVFNEMTDGYVGRYTLYPKVYINDRNNIFAPYINDLNPYLSPNTPENIYVLGVGPYCRFFDKAPSPSIISFAVNENAPIEKVLTNLEFVAEGYRKNTNIHPLYDNRAEIEYNDFFTSMRVYNSYQNTDFQSLVGKSRKHKTLWNVKIPTDLIVNSNVNIFDPTNIAVVRPKFTKRLKDKWFIVDMVYNNFNNHKFVVQSAKAIYSVNSR